MIKNLFTIFCFLAIATSQSEQDIQNNNIESLNASFDKFMKSKKNKINFLVRQSFKKSLNYSEISHAKSLKKLLKIYEQK